MDSETRDTVFFTIVATLLFVACMTISYYVGYDVGHGNATTQCVERRKFVRQP